jgi:DNA-binding response OmpR family regulator
MTSETQILLVEDDELIASGLLYALQGEGYSAYQAKSVAGAAALIEERRFDLAILDLQLPDGNGFQVRELLRATGASVIFLTVADDEGNTVRALEGGADDYITKPFRLRELLARIKAALRRRGGAAETLTLGGVTIDPASGKVTAVGAALDLTALEYRLLLTFAANKGKILTRAQILDNLWDQAGNFVEDNTLTVYIKRLREKLGESVSIETIRGIGYRADN